MTSLRTGSLCNLLGVWSRARYLGQQCAFFRTSTVSFNSSIRNTKKKIIKPVVVNVKSSKPKPEVVEIRKSMTVLELASLLDRTHDQILEALSFTGTLSKYRQPSSVIDDAETIKKLVKICGCRFKMKDSKDDDMSKENDVILKLRRPDANKMVVRPPVVTIMGHVDHGKTTLLDSLRDSNVVSQEFGGITQHIGAFSVKFKNGESVTFLDTPGHAAFSSMRARGADVTDIVVLVVAADDGVMEQTIESLKFAREAGVPIIVAINKVDKQNIDIERTKQDLLLHGIQIEELGGEVQAVSISALKGMNLDKLLECILAQAEIMELKSDPTCHVEAVCIESKTDMGRGKVVSALIRHGTLKRGQVLVAGRAWAKVRGLFDDHGQPVESAGPGTPVEVIGWRTLPSAGDKIIEVNSEQDAKKLMCDHLDKERNQKAEMDDEVIKKKMEEDRKVYQNLRKLKLQLGYRKGSSLTNKTVELGPIDPTPKLNIILKGDVDGSVEAILDIIDTYGSDKCRLNVISYDVGPVTENDVEVAKLFNGVIYTFNTKTLDNSDALAKTYGVPILDFNVIYKLVSSLMEKLNEKLPEIETEEVVGEAKVLANFTVVEGKKKVIVAGCRCTKGQLNKKKLFKLIRNDEVVLEGEVMSLKHFKNEVGTIKNDTECGLSFTNQSVAPQPGDQIICFEKVGKKQKINWNLDFL